MNRIKKTLSLDGDVVDGLAPFLEKIGIPLSAYVRFTLSQTLATFTGIGKVVDYKKPASEISLGDMVKISKALDQARLIDLTPAMTDEELKGHKVKRK